MSGFCRRHWQPRRAWRPWPAWTDHTMPITAISAMSGVLAGRGRVVSAARDQTCKVWQVNVQRGEGSYTGNACVLATLLFPAPVNDVAVDSQQTRVFAATASGVFQTNLYQSAAALVDVVAEPHKEFPHAENVSSVALSMDGSVLVAMGDSGLRVWDVASRQCVRTVADRQMAAGTAGKLRVMLAPAQLGGPSSTTTVGCARPATAQQLGAARISEFSLLPLQRLERRSGDVPSTAFAATIKTQLPDSTRDMERFLANAVQTRDMQMVRRLAPGSGGEQRVAELTRLVGRLEEHHRRTRRLNDELYQGAVTEWLAARQK
ncbi:hypothetical protein DL89DRAFT_181750 [Linderina pennispora]|uniref:Uncharacterized protein n=1 Tax=Linderina pennispora TaxID=61395 RepID=A0A1Y1W548_9FUNG|nr:uncharacterized protein DL89DRAFT_181750 [Linderina pennispora]ORX68659.1 hypothetical protein DL89DRAFT_181750 [Linderina pennispora]